MIELRCCDFKELPVTPGSARMVFTDPWYHYEHLHQWGQLAEWGAQVLEPGGVLLAYSGTTKLLDICNDMRQHLTYVGQLMVQYEPPLPIKFLSNGVPFIQGWHPLLWFAKGEYKKAKLLQTTYVCRNFEKELRWHEFQMPLGMALNYMERFTGPGDLIVDPMAGGFTTAVAAASLANRRYLGCDIDPQCIEIGKLRLKGEEPPAWVAERIRKRRGRKRKVQ